MITACVLFFAGVIPFPDRQEETVPEKAEMYMEYMDAYMLIDETGYVIGSVSEQPEDIPKINGISFTNIVVGKKLEPVEENAYQYAKKIVDSLRKNGIPVNEVYISSDLEATMYVNSVKILLGPDHKTEDKIKEMRNFYDDFKDLSGTLDMQELSNNNNGYSLRPN